MVARFTNFQAWLLEIPFTQQQREKIRAILLQDWKKPEEIKNDLTWLSRAADWERATPEDREFIRVAGQDGIVRSLRADKNNPDSQWWVAAYDQAHRPIAAGDPPLTESMVSHYTTFFAWQFEIPVTLLLKDRLHAILMEDWKKPKDLEADMKTLAYQLQMAGYEKVERLCTRTLDQPELIQKMRADTGNPKSQLLLAAYETAHPPLASGNPPLTREVSDAWSELFSFVHNQSGAPHMEASQAVKDTFARILTQTWALYPPEDQKNLSMLPQWWAWMRLASVKGWDAQLQRFVAAWQPLVNSNPGPDEQLAAALEARARAFEFAKRDANSVSEQELLQAAKDVDLVALQARKESNFQALLYAQQWEDRARVMRAGKAAYVKLQVDAQTNAESKVKADIMEEYYKAQIINRALLRKAPSLSRDGRTVVMR